MDLELRTQHHDTYKDLMTRVVNDLFSFNDTQQQRILQHYYFSEAVFSSPLLTTSGTYNIRHILLLWRTLNKYPPRVDNVCFDGETCVVFLTQRLCPRAVPLVQLELPVVVTLRFRETDLDSGLLKIAEHNESWTLEGLIQSVPFLGFWYDHVVRVLMGRVLSTSGAMIHTAVDRTSQQDLSEDQKLLLLDATKHGQGNLKTKKPPV
ncbi:hypothetical protein BCR43DRAFT_526815 [Syncephalastrum racemosum]|uniref:SigF-like NTF2-like domain-containing protein n=1 Tax=Syncephalastrum racemosum TaxID=13706 RepID=A0A1X2H5H0_SYNRA|nr:hypothetical protein BCR43DRAFT_526815 [Syncephalastrum racemosum]